MELIDSILLFNKAYDVARPYGEGCERGLTLGDLARLLDGLPTIEPERKKDEIQKFHDYQVEWLLAHCDLELEPQLEEWVVRFLHDTANCYMMEMDNEEGEQE